MMIQINSEQFLSSRHIEGIKIYLDEYNHEYYAYISTVGGRLYQSFIFDYKEDLIDWLDHKGLILK